MFGSRPPFSGTSSFSGFGTTNTQQTTGFGAGGFGRSTTFGNQGTSSGFGASTTSNTPFGTAVSTGTLFGTTGQSGTSTGTGLFGTTGTGGFGPTGTTGFNTATSNTGGGLFGTQNTAVAPSAGLFGSASTTSNAFNNQPKPFGFSTPTSGTTGGLFNTGAAGAGLFGVATGANAVVGTTIKYQPVTGTDTMTRNGVTSNIQTRIEVITCMKEYEAKSLEELRVEDYLANRKGPGAGGLLGGGFGQSTAGGGLFGSNTGATATGGLFGQKVPENKTLFGTTTNTMGFGATASSSGGGLFGSTNTAPTFGQATTGTSQGFSFGQNTQQSQNKTGFSFLPNTGNASGGLFGQQQTNTGFGATNTGFSFGQTATSQQNQTGGLFNQVKPAFGAVTSTSGGLFGNKTIATPGFGGFSTGSTAFGATTAATPFGGGVNTSGGLFGNTQNKTGFGLGTTPAFGSTGSAFNTGTSGGGLFGGTNTNTGGLFGNTANQNKPAGGLTFNTGNTFNTGSNSLGFGLNANAIKPTGFGALGGGFGTAGTLGNNTNMMGNNMAVQGTIGDNNIANLIKALTDNPFGHSSLLKTPMTITGKADEFLGSPDGTTSSSKLMHTASQPPTYVLPSSGTSKTSNAVLLPRSNTATANTGSLLTNRSLLFAGLDDITESNGGDEMFKTKSFPSVKKLNLKVFNSIKSGGVTSQPASGASSPCIGMGEGVRAPLSLTTPLHRPVSPPRSAISPHLSNNNSNLDDSNSATPDIIKGRSNMKRLNLANKKSAVVFNDTLADLNVMRRDAQYKDKIENAPRADTSEVNFSLFEASSQEFSEANLNSSNQQPHPTGLKLTRAGYYTIPSLPELADLIDDSGRCVVENFSVGREGYGNICFSAETDVTDLDLDNIVFIVRKEVEVYPDSSTKPPVGEGLNKTAVVTLDAVWPVDKSSRDVIQDTERLEAIGWSRYLEKKCLSMGAKFIEYRPDTGSWVFKVNHFSKYGLQDDNDEFDTEEVAKALQQQQQSQLQKSQAIYDIDQQQLNLRKAHDISQIKSSKKSTKTTDGATNMSSSDSVSTTATTSSTSLSSSSSGLGGVVSNGYDEQQQQRGAYCPGAGPTSQMLLSPPPTHHLLPALHADAATHLHKNSPSLGVSTAAASAAPVPGELFLDSFANEPMEGASLGAAYINNRSNKTLQQLTANMFPMDEDEDVQQFGDGYGTATLLGASDMEVTTLGQSGVDTVTARLRSGVMGMDEEKDAVPSSWKENVMKKFAPSKQIESGLSFVESPAGRLSPCLGEHTAVRAHHAPHRSAALLYAHHGLDPSCPSPAYRAPRSQYAHLPSEGGQTDHSPIVNPHHNSTLLPLSQSLVCGQQRSISDSAAFMGRSFRVGWGPALTLLHLGEPLGTQVDVGGSSSTVSCSPSRDTPHPLTSFLFLPSSSNVASASYSTRLGATQAARQAKYEVHVERLHLTDLSTAGGPDPSTVLRTVEACLQDTLRCSITTPSGPATAPYMQPARGRTLLHKLAATLHRCEEEHVQQLQEEGGEEEQYRTASLQLSSIVDLCVALWGRLEYGWLEDAAANSPYTLARARVEALSAWLERVGSTAVRDEVRAVEERDDTDEEGYLDTVLSYLTVREVHRACTLLQEKGDHHLALLLAQSCMGDDTSRQIAYKQLCNWSEYSADATLCPARLILYVLAAGRPTYHSGAGLVNVCRGLDWRRAFALHLWYTCPATSTVSEALNEYERGAGLVQGEEKENPIVPYCQEPLPQYLTKHAPLDSASSTSYDVCYHLLKLYTDSSYRLDQLMNPSTNTPDPLDVTTSWILMALVHSLGYSHVSLVVANSLHLAMAAHLEAAGLWHWAIFVHLAIKDEKGRAAEVRSVLNRHVQVVEGVEWEDDTFATCDAEQQNMSMLAFEAGQAMDMTRIGRDNTPLQRQEVAAMEEEDIGFVDGDDDNSMDADISKQTQSAAPSAEERGHVSNIADECQPLERQDEEYGELSTYEQREAFLIHKLQIPEMWINESKAILARSLDMSAEEAWYLIKAGDLKKAHTLLVDIIAPNAIINEEQEYLQRFITAFERSAGSRLSMLVPEWLSGGGVYAHYLHVLSTIAEMKASQKPTQHKIEALRPSLLALCSQLNSLRTPTARHRLCVSEMSRVVVGVLRAVLGEDLAATTAVANTLAALPLSQDCVLQELNTLTHQYLAGIAN